MLKEQIAKILYGSEDYPSTEKRYLLLAQAILNLFKAEVDKLTVIDDEEFKAELLKYYIGICQTNPPQMPNQTDTIWCCLKAQLQHTKKQLLDLMGE